LKKMGLISASIAGAVFGFVWVKGLVQADPFRHFNDLNSIPSSVGIELKNVDLWHYNLGALRTRAKVDQVLVRQDRQVLDFYGVHDGLFRADKGSVQFEGGHANWDTGARKIDVVSGGRVYGPQFNLHVTRFSVDSPTSVLRVVGPIEGDLGEGKLVTRNLLYHLDSGDYWLGPASWKGKLDLQAPDTEPTKPSFWDIETKDSSYHHGDIDHFPHATATNGDLLVKADVIERQVKTGVITATGNVSYFSSEVNLVCSKAVILTKEKKSVLTGDVHMVFKPKSEQSEKLIVIEIPPFRPQVPDEIAKNRPTAPAPHQDDEVHSSKNLRKFRVMAMGEEVQYWYGKGHRHAIITGNPQARQELPGGHWRHIWSPKALYDGEAETLLLQSSSGKMDTRLMTSLGDDLSTTFFKVSTKDETNDENDDYETGPLKGTVAPTEEEAPDLPEPKKKPAPKTVPALPGNPA
jgi:hypothetical protein